VEGSFEHGNEPSGCTRCWETVEWLHNGGLSRRARLRGVIAVYLGTGQLAGPNWISLFLCEYSRKCRERLVGSFNEVHAFSAMTYSPYTIHHHAPPYLWGLCRLLAPLSPAVEDDNLWKNSDNLRHLIVIGSGAYVSLRHRDSRDPGIHAGSC
jgi:hypothetical protein